MCDSCDSLRLIGQPYQCRACYAWLVPGDSHRIPEDCERYEQRLDEMIAMLEAFDLLEAQEET